MHSPFSFWNALKIPIKIASRSDYTSDKVNYWEVGEGGGENDVEEGRIGWQKQEAGIGNDQENENI